MKSPSCRLFVIPARDVPLAVILRRGPSKWYHLIMWDMENDTFTEGAWFKGRIYEDCCDLSPDGKLFVYKVLKGHHVEESYSHSWTALSRPPWLHALTLWQQGGGGGEVLSELANWCCAQVVRSMETKWNRIQIIRFEELNLLTERHHFSPRSKRWKAAIGAGKTTTER